MNQIAFSTLSCPDWDWDQIVTAAQTYGYDALELRGYLNSMDLPSAEPFTIQNRASTRRRLEDIGIAVCCISSSGVVAQANLDHVRAHCELASALGAPMVRVFGGNLPEGTPRQEAIAHAAITLRSFGDAAQAEGVQIVLETHDAFSTGESVAELLAATDHPSVYALWDLHHPYRQGESPEETCRYLAGKIRHVHIKDSKDGAYTLFGEGDVPLDAMLALLRATNYDGPISVEWEKRWHPEIADPEIALPQYARKMRGLSL
jgi:sugar phosphate isomerase/epimerase